MGDTDIAPEWLTADEVAELCRVKRRTVYRWIDRGLPVHRWEGRLLRFRRAEVLEWVEHGRGK